MGVEIFNESMGVVVSRKVIFSCDRTPDLLGLQSPKILSDE